MNGGAVLAALPAILTAVLLVTGAGVTLIGTLGLLRLRTFYERVHAPTLGTTLGTVFIALASIIHFSALGSRLAVHEALIVIFVTVTTPVSLIVLVRGAVFRDRMESGTAAGGADGQPPNITG